MQRFTLLVLAAVATMALAEGQFYVPRSYYVIDAAGHESVPVPLRRLRRSIGPIPIPYGSAGANANANANANAEANGGGAEANANANARAIAGAGGWGLPGGAYGSGNPLALRAGESRRQYGPAYGHSVSATSSVGVDSAGSGYYDQITAVQG